MHNRCGAADGRLALQMGDDASVPQVGARSPLVDGLTILRCGMFVRRQAVSWQLRRLCMLCMLCMLCVSSGLMAKCNWRHGEGLAFGSLSHLQKGSDHGKYKAGNGIYEVCSTQINSAGAWLPQSRQQLHTQQ